MNICVVGTGYVGLVAGTCLSDFGINVICIDKDEQKIEMLKQGKSPIYEIGLTDMIQRNTKLERLHFSVDLKDAIKQSQVIFIGVGTPEKEDGRADLSYVEDVIAEIAATMDEYKVIVMKSTVPVGTAKRLREFIIANRKNEVDFDIVSNPEFLREGSAVDDFLRPDRIIIGSDSERALAIMKDVYRPLYLLETPILNTSNETAELIKYASNTMLAMKISFINEVANLCEKVGADVYQVAVGVGMDKRIGPKFLHPGPGYGGSCFPKDVQAIVEMSHENGYNFKMAEAILEVNTYQHELIVKKVKSALGELKSKNIALLGLAFKPNTDDIREAPAIYIARRLLEEGATVSGYDPAAMTQAQKEMPQLNLFENPFSACENADIILVMTEWNEFRDINLERIKQNVRNPIIFDTRNIYNPQKVKDLGFKYICTGRPGVEN